jgi:starvation-inducible DNA-binding protein
MALFPTRNDLPADTRAKICDLLNGLLADTFDLFSQTKQAHWNVKGRDFYQLHKLFDELAETLLEPVDDLAERITELGGVAKGTARMAASNSRVPEYPLDAVDSLEHVRHLADRYAVVAKTMRQGIDQADEWGDKDTADLCTEISRSLDKSLWFIEAHLIEKK